MAYAPDRPTVETLSVSDSVAKIIRVLCAQHDAARREIDPDEVLAAIKASYRDQVLAIGEALGWRCVRRMIREHLRQASSLNPSEIGPQIAIPGLERVQSHVSYEVNCPGSGKTKVLTRFILDAELWQMDGQISLQERNIARCTNANRELHRARDFLAETGSPTIRVWQEQGQHAAA